MGDRLELAVPADIALQLLEVEFPDRTAVPLVHLRGLQLRHRHRTSRASVGVAEPCDSPLYGHDLDRGLVELVAVIAAVQELPVTSRLEAGLSADGTVADLFAGSAWVDGNNAGNPCDLRI